MGYHKQAASINHYFKKHFEGISEDQRGEIINVILRFGQVAKYRCRQNTAYDNFSRACFNGIAKLERSQPEHLSFPVLHVVDDMSGVGEADDS